MVEFPEMRELLELSDAFSKNARVKVEGMSACQNYPLITVTIGSAQPSAPALILVGGVHGIENIGTHVVIAFMRYILHRLSWDELLNEMLERIRIVFFPLVNPGGMAMRWRANPRGVDLMRNSPVIARSSKIPLISGHRIGPWLPWYAGGGALEPEAAVLARVIEELAFQSSYAVSLDIHSGFGMVDRLWFPYANSNTAFSRIAEVDAWTTLLNRSLMHHIYRVEPQTRSYVISGDLWDHMSLEHDQRGRGVYLPWTLEMGSWSWLRKNPMQLLSVRGMFNPMKAHRLRRTLRRHLPLFDWLMRSTFSNQKWLPQLKEEAKDATKRWYA